MMSKISRQLRGLLNTTTRKVWKNELSRKHAVVFYENMKSFGARSKVNKDDFSRTFILDEFRPFQNVYRIDDHYKANAFYGISATLKAYSGYHNKIAACIEHGLFCEGYSEPHEIKKSGLPGLITMGHSREIFLKSNSNKIVIPLGPYIQYATPTLNDEEISCLKDLYGRTLVVFPAHSSSASDAHSDWPCLESEIQRISNLLDIKTVIINLFYKNITAQEFKKLKDKGYVVACCGNRYNPYFLANLRSIIQLADYSMSDSVGTHIGYCVSENVPHYVVPRKANRSFKSKTDQRIFESKVAHHDSKKSDVDVIASSFMQPVQSITQNQSDICKYYWGTDITLGRAELKRAFEDIENRLNNNIVYDAAE